MDDCGGEDRVEGGDFAVVVRWNDLFTGFASPLTDERSNGDCRVGFLAESV